MKKRIIILSLLVVTLCIFAGCDEGATTENQEDAVTITDACGRSVDVPEDISRVAPTGTIAEMMILSIAPEKLIGLCNAPSESQGRYYPAGTAGLPVFGQFYGKKADLNMEALLAAKPQLIIDIGSVNPGQKEDMDSLQKQIGVPVIFLDGSLGSLKETYMTLGKLLKKEEKAEEISQYIEATLEYAESHSTDVVKKKKIYYGLGPDGLSCNAKGSIQADVIEIIGAENAVTVPENEITGKNGGTIISLEKLYEEEPDVLLFTEKSTCEEIEGGAKEWAGLKAVKKGTCYEIPQLPYCWLGGPPSVNRILGIWWLGNLCYPEIYDIDMIDEAKKFYSLFWEYDLSDEEAEEILQTSTLKVNK